MVNDIKEKIRYLDRYRNSMNKYESLKRQESWEYPKVCVNLQTDVR